MYGMRAQRYGEEMDVYILLSALLRGLLEYTGQCTTEKSEACAAKNGQDAAEGRCRKVARKKNGSLAERHCTVQKGIAHYALIEQ
jgi:hypothetical protein